MRLVKATLFGLIVAALTMMWTSRDYLTEAYDTTPQAQQVRLSGVDLDVEPRDVGPSPFAIPAAPDTRRSILPSLSPTEPPDGELPVVEINNGKARLFGTVLGPDGPVAGATVAIERITSQGSGELRVTTNGEGAWTAARLPGGKYRVRAWVPGLMTTGVSDVRYVNDDDKAEYSFSVWGVDPTPQLEFIHGGPIFAGGSGTVAVSLTSRSIDENGVVVTAPNVGALISLQTTSEVAIASDPVQMTNAEGLVFFTLNCFGPVSGGTATARTGLLASTFDLPGCRSLPEPEPVAPGLDNGDPGIETGAENG